MFCFIYKWMILRNLDTGKNIPHAVVYHLKNCPSCRNFTHQMKSLNSKLIKESSTFALPERSALADRIIAQINSEPTPLPNYKSGFFRGKLFPAPAFAVTLLLILAVLMGIFFFTGDSPSSNNFYSPFEEFTDLPSLTTAIQDIGNAESPMENELNLLGQSIKSAAKVLITNLDFAFGQIDTK